MAQILHDWAPIGTVACLVIVILGNAFTIWTLRR